MDHLIWVISVQCLSCQLSERPTPSLGSRKISPRKNTLMCLTRKILQSMDENSFTLNIYLDFSRGFDKIDLQILLSKLNHYGIRGTAHSLLKSYLSNRKRFVYYNNSKSSNLPILGPLVFLLYINDMVNSSILLNFILFVIIMLF